MDSTGTICTPASSSRPAAAATSGTVAPAVSVRETRLPPSRTGGSRTQITADAFATSIPAARSYRSWYSSSSTSSALSFCFCCRLPTWPPILQLGLTTAGCPGTQVSRLGSREY